MKKSLSVLPAGLTRSPGLVGLALLAFLAAGLPTQALADDLAFNASVATEYRYRGISQSRFKPALQGGVDYAMGGFYVGAWASSIKWIKDANGGADAEIDVYAGYKGTFSKDGVGYDVGVLTYQYPGHDLAVSPNTTEIYGALSFGPATLKYSHSLSNLFGFDDSKNSGYLDLSASFDVGNGVMVAPHIGYQKVRGNGDFSYTDFALSVSKDFNGWVPSLTLYATDTKRVAGSYAYISPSGKNLGRTGVVLAVKYNF